MVLITMGIVIRMTNIEQGILNSEGGRGTTEYTEHTEGESVQSGESLLARSHSGENDRSPGGTGGQTGKSAPQLSEAVKALLEQDGKKHNYASLLKAINALDADMSTTDVAALRDMLNFPNDRFPENMRSMEIKDRKSVV